MSMQCVRIGMINFATTAPVDVMATRQSPAPLETRSFPTSPRNECGLSGFASFLDLNLKHLHLFGEDAFAFSPCKQWYPCRAPRQ